MHQADQPGESEALHRHLIQATSRPRKKAFGAKVGLIQSAVLATTLAFGGAVGLSVARAQAVLRPADQADRARAASGAVVGQAVVQAQVVTPLATVFVDCQVLVPDPKDPKKLIRQTQRRQVDVDLNDTTRHPLQGTAPNQFASFDASARGARTDSGELIKNLDRGVVILGNANFPNIHITGNDYGACIIGGAKADHLLGGEGPDFIDGRGGDDWIEGDEGNDVLLGGDGNDHVDGGSGNDFIDGGTGINWLEAGPGRDEIHGSDESTCDGGSGDDDIDGCLFVLGGKGEDQLKAGQKAVTHFLRGDDDEDTLIGGPGNDFLEGGAGDDFLDGRAGLDDCHGDKDFDTAKNCEVTEDVEVIIP
jgi:Ca2+-binding RTX toxin-like protein